MGLEVDVYFNRSAEENANKTADSRETTTRRG
jgi:hypothetical protein